MRKSLLSLALVATCVGIGSAQDVTFDFSNVSINEASDSKIVLTGTKSGNNVQPLEKAEYQGVTLSFDVNGASTKPAWYASPGDIRTYAKSKITFTAPSGKTVEQIVFTFTSSWGSTNYNNLELSSGSLDPLCSADNKPNNGMTVTWTKNSDVNEVTFTVPAAKTFNTANPQFRFIKAVVTIGNGGGQPTAPSAPTISGESNFYGDSTPITITAGANCDIYYTLDGSTPSASSTKYSEAFSISATTTVKAIAVREGLSSEVAEATFTKATPVNVASIEDFLDQESGTVCKFTGTLTVVYQYKGYLFVQDPTGGLQFFTGSISTEYPGTYAMGQSLTGVVASRDVYLNNPQGAVKNFLSTFPTAATGEGYQIDPKVIVADDLTKHLNEYVVLGSQTITKTGNNYFCGSVQLYNRFGLAALTDDIMDSKKDVAGFAVVYNTTPELYYTKIDADGLITGIEGLQEDAAVIYGAEGYIVAPEGAQVYNVAGANAGTENLPAGIYVVVANGRAYKVIVK